MTLIGRDHEQYILQNSLESKKSEFIAVYGRRRVGKTFLIKEFFNSHFAFYATGILNGSREEQLKAWNDEIQRYGGLNLNPAKNWYEAFCNLNSLMERQQPAVQ